jgi:parallel beta-helix repeat protein
LENPNGLIIPKSSNPLIIDGPTILIDDTDPNYDWSITAWRKSWCTGLGTKNDPYVIQNIKMDGTSLEACLYIRMSSKYFVIKNCVFYNAKVGIKMERVSNGQIRENNCTLNEFGISTYRSHYNIFSDNLLTYNDQIGMILENSYYNTISENMAENNQHYGIKIESSYGTIVSHNYARHNSQDGIKLQYSYDNTITDNTADFNAENGISLDESNNNIIKNNFAKNNKGSAGGGIYLALSYENDIIDNKLENNEKYGIDLQTSDSNSVLRNILSEHGEYGVVVYDSSDNYIFDNQITRNGVGICLVNSDNNRILNNTFQDNGQCAKEEEECKNNFFKDNFCVQLFPSVSGYNFITLFVIVATISLVMLHLRKIQH